jgi:hypothetical protein
LIGLSRCAVDYGADVWSGYFNGGGITSGRCGTASTIVLTMDTIVEHASS